MNTGYEDLKGGLQFLLRDHSADQIDRLVEYHNQRVKLLSLALPAPKSPSDKRKAVLFNLAVDLYRSSLGADYYRSHEHFKAGLALALDRSKARSQYTIDHFALDCHGEACDFLSRNLWKHNEMPDPSRLELVIRYFENEWKYNVLRSPLYSSEMDLYDQEVAIRSSENVAVLYKFTGK